MIQDLTISYVCNGIKTNLTIEDEHYDNLPYKLADMFEKLIRESDANPQIVIENLKNAFDYEYKEILYKCYPYITLLQIVRERYACTP